jgi:hypothetical protein
MLNMSYSAPEDFAPLLMSLRSTITAQLWQAKLSGIILKARWAYAHWSFSTISKLYACHCGEGVSIWLRGVSYRERHL